MREETIVVGAGPAGLAVSACLRKLGRPFVLLDRATEVGSAWRRHYDRLHLHTAKDHSALPHQPFPRELPTYVSREQFVSYLEEYARRFELTPRLGEGVTRAERKDNGWRVETSKGQYEAGNLVIATGYSAVPNRPSFPGQERFAGTIAHSAEYKNAQGYRGKKVLVVGAGNTGAEIALDLTEHGAASVDLCVRSPIHVVNRDMLGVPAQVLGILCAWIPVPVLDVLFGMLVAITVGNLNRFGIRAPGEGILAQIRRLGRIPLIDIGTIALVRSGRVRVRPDIRELTEDGVVFTEGTGAYDAIVLATGYRTGLDAFLGGHERVLDARGYPRRSGSETEVDGLYFVGFKNVVTGLLREIGREAERVSEAIARRGPTR
jgi:indole-3-pyruvate monooxygenase